MLNTIGIKAKKNETLNRSTIGNHLDLQMVQQKKKQKHTYRLCITETQHTRNTKGIANERSKKKHREEDTKKPDPTSSHSF